MRVRRLILTWTHPEESASHACCLFVLREGSTLSNNEARSSGRYTLSNQEHTGSPQTAARHTAHDSTAKHMPRRRAHKHNPRQGNPSEIKVVKDSSLAQLELIVHDHRDALAQGKGSNSKRARSQPAISTTLSHQTTRMVCRQTLDVAAPSDI